MEVYKADSSRIGRYKITAHECGRATELITKKKKTKTSKEKKMKSLPKLKKDEMQCTISIKQCGENVETYLMVADPKSDLLGMAKDFLAKGDGNTEVEFLFSNLEIIEIEE